MKFELVKVRRIKSGGSKYVLWIQETTGISSRLEFKVFQTEEEMLTALNLILATQKGDRSVTDGVLRLIQSPDGHQWTGQTALDLTIAQAASLGWTD